MRTHVLGPHLAYSLRLGRNTLFRAITILYQTIMIFLKEGVHHQAEENQGRFHRGSNIKLRAEGQVGVGPGRLHVQSKEAC